MSIRKRLMLTNLGMVFIPIILFFVVEIILGYIIFVIFQGTPSGDQLNLFITVRFISIILILILTNGLLTYFMSKSILTPIEKLSTAAKKISEGDLEFNIHSNKNDELGNLINTFEMMRAELKKSKEAQLQYEKNRQELIASISHDLRTPLTSIKGYIIGLKDGVANTPEKLNRYMDIIYQTANDMDQLIDELFLYSKLELEKVPFHYGKVDLYTFFADYIEELNLQLENENGTAKLLANKSDDLIVYADHEKLKRVVMNIVQNSRKYFDKENNEIAVILTTNSNEVTVEIKDNGSGIKKEEIPYIFDRFHRTDSSRNTATGGSGLGLSIVKKIIEAHGGTVWADSEIGQGTSIYFTLKKVMKMKKVLIIEDEQNIAQLEQDYLEVHGIESDIATTGEEGLNLATTNSYNLIILDLMLPGIDGFALCEKLRKNLDIPILMVTARKEDIDKIKGFDRGADDYIVKPFNPNELVTRVKAHLSRYDRLTNRNNTSTDIQINNLLIQPDARRIFVNGEEIIFTAKEFDLLYFLATNQDIVFTKEHLFERIWGYDALGDTSTVTVHIRKIREKIEEDPSNPKFIETVWGAGYRFKKQ